MRHAPYLITRPRRELLIAAPGVGFAGRFGYEISRRGVVHTAVAPKSNLITDAGLNALGTTPISTLINYIGVGSGTSPASYADTQLEQQVGPRTNSTGGFSNESGYDSTTDPANPFWYRRIVRTFSEGAFGGSAVNLAEIGTFQSAAGGVMWSRQRIRDVNGQPTTIQVQPDEQLKVFYEWRVYPPTQVVEQEITVKGATRTIRNRSYRINANDIWGFDTNNGLSQVFGTWVMPGVNAGQLYELNAMPGLTGSQTGSGAGVSSGTLHAYTNGSLYREQTMVWNPGTANFPSGTIGSAGFNPRGWSGANSWFISTFDPAPPKTPEDRVVIGLRTAWDRAALPAGHLI